MPQTEAMKVLAVGIDSLPGELAKRLMKDGDMPFLASLAQEGRVVDVESTAELGGASVWPVFVSGRSVKELGITINWVWQPSTMSVTHYAGDRAPPFWQVLHRKGYATGVVDIPLVSCTGCADGFEVDEWGAHDVARGRMSYGPPSIGPLLSGLPRHPFGNKPPQISDFSDLETLERFTLACFEGISKRGDLAEALIKESGPDFGMFVFPEIHHAGHHLWHTIEPQHPLYRGLDLPTPQGPSLIDMCREVDSQLERLASLVADDGSIFVFSLHGMKPSYGVPSLLTPFLRKNGYAADPTWRSMSWAERRAQVFSVVKQRAPRWVKDAYHRRTSIETQIRLARSTILGRQDWARTRAFSLSTDDHGYVRVNLRGRERLGIVEPENYEPLCEEIEQTLRAYAADDGRPLVRKIIRTAADADEALDLTIPDLVIHWEDAAMEVPVRVSDPELVSPRIGVRTGLHNTDAFCIGSGTAAGSLTDPVPATEFHQVLIGPFEQPKHSRK